MISLAFLATALVVVLAPGTGVIYVLSVALTRGLRPALAAVVGCTFGIVPHLLAATLGLAAVLHASALAFQIVKFAGVAFLIWMAWKTWAERGALETGGTSPAGPFAIAARGALINVLNPKLSLFFLAFLPQFLVPEAGGVTAQMLLLGGIFSAMTAAVFALYAVFAAAARSHVLGSARAMRVLRGTFAAAFAVLAGRLAVESRG
ncbi:LysE family translocator [Roseobacter sp. HKCCA0434]|uniref:LysE family translocator n=1 Tax=Roseobacter sp. HKCCA0434 TaxID=3079297 RepID=UPI0029058A4F|nr:LysE family translocator [Roseobacter sp. HKCCA0434]